jgi:hypothetical protein
VTFSLILGLGATLGLAWSLRNLPEARALRNLDAGLWALFGGLLGGRLVHVAAGWSYYGGHPLEIPQVWLGGVSGPGSAAGFWCALFLYAACYGLPTGMLSDELLPLGLAVGVSAWLACWLDGTAYGVTVASWGGIPARDEWGQWMLRWPVQLLGAGLTLLIFWILDKDHLSALASDGRQPASWFRQAISRLAGSLLNNPAGTRSRWAFWFLTLEFGMLSMLRADPTFIYRGLRLDTWAWLGLIGLSTLAILFYTTPWMKKADRLGDKG